MAPSNTNRKLSDLSLGGQVLFFTAATFLMMSNSIFITLSKDNGEMKYSSFSVAMTVEFCKLVASLVFLFREEGISGGIQKITNLSGMSLALFSIPAIMYTFNNNLMFYMLSWLDPTSFQILNNMKIISTAILFRIVFNRILGGVKWVAIFLLVIGAILSQLHFECDCEGGGGGGIGLSTSGLLVGLLQAFLSGCTGVYTEWAMKSGGSNAVVGKKPHPTAGQSIHLQNLQLYIFGALLNLFVGMVRSSHDDMINEGESVSFFHNWTGWVFLLIVIQTGNGLLISFVMKFADNLVKVYLSTTAMVLTALVSTVLFAIIPQITLVLGMFVVMASIYLYNVPIPEAPKIKSVEEEDV